MRRQRHEAPQRREVLAQIKISTQAADEFIEQVFFRRLQRLNPLFDGAGRHHTINEHRALLADPVDPIDRLRFDRRIPPRVEQENIVGRVERDSCARRLQRDEHGSRTLRGLKPLHRFETVKGHPREFVTRQLRKVFLQRLTHATEEHHELRKNHDLVAATDDFGELLHQQIDLSRIGERGIEPRQHIRIATRLAQTREEREEPETLLAHRRADVVAQPIETLGANPRIRYPLHIGERANQIHLHFRRQLRGDCFLRAPQNKGSQLGAEPRQRTHPVGLQGALKRRTRTEQPRQQEAEDAPQVELTVLQGRARQHNAVLGADRETGLRNFCVWILDELPLVEHRVTELHTRQHGPVFA